MSDLDQQLRDLFQHKQAAVGPPPPLPPGLHEVPPTRWWSRPRHWLLVPVTAVATAAVVIPIALVSQNAGVTAMPAQETQTWADDVCTTRPSARSPGQDDVRTMSVVASAVCWWENPANLGDDTVGLQNITTLSPSQITDMKGFLADAPREQPTCSMIDSPPQVEYYVFLRDADGGDWRIDIPEPPCLGFEMQGGQYRSASLVNWLQGMSKEPLLVTAKDWDGTSTQLARLEGTLGVDEKGCVTVGDTVVMWPNTYFLGMDRAGTWVIVTGGGDSGRGYGTVLAEEGESVVLAGGLTPYDVNPGPLPLATHSECLVDDYWTGVIEVQGDD